MSARLERGDLGPAIVAAPPGPRSRALAQNLAQSEAPGVNTLGPDGEASVVWAEALGANVLDVDGNRYVDLTAGFGVAAVGHRHPRVVAAVATQTAGLVHGLGDVAAHPARVELARRLAGLAPVDEPRVHFAVSGADAIEVALKTALAATARPGILAFEPAYHGVTLGALAASSREEFRRPFVRHLHPHVARLPFAAPVESIARALAGGHIGAVVVEPVVGREGVLVPPPGWLTGLAAATREAGALLVADEIFTGFGRTGCHFAVEREGVRPDLLCVGKALGGGLPIAAAIGRREVMEVWRTRGEALHTATFLAHPLACAAALATLDVLADERLVERAAALGERLAGELARIAERHAPRVSARGVGALWALELTDADATRRVVEACRAGGVLVLAGGPAGRVVELAPPLVITDDQLDRALAVVEAAVAAAETADVG